MKSKSTCLFICFAILAFISSCSTLEKASSHGFTSGYYKLESGQKNVQKVYVNVTDAKIDIYDVTGKKPDTSTLQSITQEAPDSVIISPVIFKKNSIDIDITAILLKYRPAVFELPAQVTTDFNVALYAGWRHDSYTLKSKIDPLGMRHQKISNLGYDFGFFAGPGGTQINPFTTQNQRTDEYSGLIIQTGLAAFIESYIASFGICIGIDYLLNSDRDIWIYTNKPWVGFIVGIALN
jgi:hypothetical protein